MSVLIFLKLRNILVIYLVIYTLKPLHSNINMELNGNVWDMEC